MRSKARQTPSTGASCRHENARGTVTWRVRSAVRFALRFACVKGHSLRQKRVRGGGREGGRCWRSARGPWRMRVWSRKEETKP